MVAIKADTGIPWEKLKKLSRCEYLQNIYSSKKSFSNE
jgi:hypothetical protein